MTEATCVQCKQGTTPDDEEEYLCQDCVKEVVQIMAMADEHHAFYYCMSCSSPGLLPTSYPKVKKLMALARQQAATENVPEDSVGIVVRDCDVHINPLGESDDHRTQHERLH